MADWAEDQDPYQILSLSQGHESTEAEIKKVHLHPLKSQHYFYAERV